MEPRIQYAKTADGVSIAYATMGDGMPLVFMSPLLWGHLLVEPQNLVIGSWFQRLAEKRRLIRYDNRGSGLSDRDAINLSLDSFQFDLEAVVDHLGLEKFCLMGPAVSGPVAIAYAARHPERVSHLILWCTSASPLAESASEQHKATKTLVEKDWELFTETAAHVLVGWKEADQASWLAEYMRESITQEAYHAYHAVRREFDVGDLLRHVSSPTLVLHRRQLRMVPVEFARTLAANIPSARLAIMEGKSPMPWGEGDAILEAIDEFLSEGAEVEPKPELPEGMAVILFADIVESTSLTEELGDAAFREKARELDTSLRAVIGECQGTPVEGKLVGDGVLAVFTSARQAIDCALRCDAAGEPLGLQLHLGIHAGDVIREGNNIYGGAVNIAARIATASAPGEVLVSDTVRGLARTSAGVAFDDRGEHSLKGVADPQRLFAVRGGG
ncbi:MAG: adenylate/guanylate cyclase domain-containing protein [Dehalococcoidia bacterium]